MGILGMILTLLGVGVSLVFGIILLIQAFKESIIWGLVYLFVPFGAFVYIFKYWDNAKKPFLYSLLGIPPMILGGVLAGMSAGG